MINDIQALANYVDKVLPKKPLCISLDTGHILQLQSGRTFSCFGTETLYDDWFVRAGANTSDWWVSLIWLYLCNCSQKQKEQKFHTVGLKSINPQFI